MENISLLCLIILKGSESSKKAKIYFKFETFCRLKAFSYWTFRKKGTLTHGKNNKLRKNNKIHHVLHKRNEEEYDDIKEKIEKKNRRQQLQVRNTGAASTIAFGSHAPLSGTHSSMEYILAEPIVAWMAGLTV